jgi:hypothetical protein
MLRLIIAAVVTIFSGIGVGKIADKVAADKVPAYPTEGIGTGWTPAKIGFFVAAAVIGTVVTKFIGKKLNIKILK